ncbi:MAG: hypothetical protein FRX48_02693 [Lasallia pustulata]|uniref:Uncharacterized protein n=1 Tax=Lasallia pustulata TaxID=136370 RepID=A0A5M8Q059_9LECA|nr:MAG: hypothetical protein FRX48_02693 [Lasallia pustulata]
MNGIRTDRAESPDSSRAPEPVDTKHACSYTELTETRAFPETVPSFKESSERDDEANYVSILIEEAIKLENPDGYTDAPGQSSAITPALLFRMRHDIVEAAYLALVNSEESAEHVGSDDVRPNREANERADERADEGSDDDGYLGRTIYRLIHIIQVIHNEQVDRLDKSQETFG